MAVSAALASGISPDSESEVLTSFVESLRRVTVVQAVANRGAFRLVSEIQQRPALIVIPWADPGTTSEHQTLARELSIHLAATFFLTQRPGNLERA